MAIALLATALAMTACSDSDDDDGLTLAPDTTTPTATTPTDTGSTDTGPTDGVPADDVPTDDGPTVDSDPTTTPIPGPEQPVIDDFSGLEAQLVNIDISDTQFEAWRCDVEIHDYDVGYRLSSDGTVRQQHLDPVEQFGANGTWQANSSDSILIDYTESGASEDVSSIDFISSNEFEAFSSIETGMLCVRDTFTLNQGNSKGGSADGDWTLADE